MVSSSLSLVKLWARCGVLLIGVFPNKQIHNGGGLIVYFSIYLHVEGLQSWQNFVDEWAMVGWLYGLESWWLLVGSFSRFQQHITKVPNHLDNKALVGTIGGYINENRFVKSPLKLTIKYL